MEASAGSDASNVIAGVPQPGDVVAGKFVVERVIGIGGMGVVVAARHSHLGQTVAIKFLRREAARDGAAVSRFLREAQAVAGLQSDHVVRVMDAGTLEDGLPFMVMEHLTGHDLGQMLEERGRLPLKEALEYLLQAMEAIAEAHALGIVHRDLKPSNLFVTVRPDGAPFVKVLDFGISKALETSGVQQMNLTATSMTLGSPLYMSPEQVRSSKNVDARTDVWALGVILYEVLVGLQPFEAETVTGLCAKIVADEPMPLRASRPELPMAFETVVMRCLNKNPAHRYASVGELSEALKPFASPDGKASADRIMRITGPRLTLASVSDASGPVVARSKGSRVATGFAETVATWQTAGGLRRKRVVTMTAATVGAIVFISGAVAITKPSRESLRVAPATSGAASSIGGIVATAPSVVPTPVVLAPPEPAPALSNDQAVVAPVLPSASSMGPRIGPASRHTGMVKGPGAFVPASAKTQDDLLLDRK